MRVSQHCQVFQAVKPRTGYQPYGTRDFWPVPDEIFMSLSFDFLALPKCDGSDGRQYDTCLVIVDRLSGYIQAIPCLKEGLTSKRLAQLFFDHWLLRHGLPLEILSDNDVLVTAEFFVQLCVLLGIQQHTAVIYRPSGNGRAERAVRTVVDIVRATLNTPSVRSNWLTVLPWCIFMQNSLPGVVNGHSPNKIVYGRDLYLPGELPPLAPLPRDTRSDEFFLQLEQLRKKVHTAMTNTHNRLRNKYMQTHQQVQYEPGDKVWVQILPRDTVDRRTQKLRPLWHGPCEILGHVVAGKYRVQTHHGIEELHMDQMKPYRLRIDGTALPFHWYSPDPEKPSSDDRYVVERIIRHRVVNGRWEWLVKWKGFDDPQWQPIESFCPEVQSDWLDYLKRNRLNPFR